MILSNQKTQESRATSFDPFTGASKTVIFAWQFHTYDMIVPKPRDLQPAKHALEENSECYVTYLLISHYLYIIILAL